MAGAGGRTARRCARGARHGANDTDSYQGKYEMRQDNRYLEPKDEETFLEMCRLAASEETGGQWTDEKIDAIEAVELDPRAAVRRLFEMYSEEQQKAAEAERELAGRATDTYVKNMGTAIRITVGSLTSLYAERRKSGGAKVYIQVGNSFMGLDLGEFAAAAFADWLQPRV